MSIVSKFKTAIVAVALSATVFTPSAHAFSSMSSSGGNTPTLPEEIKPPTVATKTINQGDEIYMLNSVGQPAFTCTLGYIGSQYALTAGHCGNEGTNVTTNKGVPIGYIEKVDMDNNQDIAFIKLSKNVTGTNKYSGDYITSIGELEKDDTICFYGNTTKQVTCTPLFGLPRHGTVWSSGVAKQGDSGGAMWIEGKGLIGILSSITPSYTTGTEAWVSAEKFSAFNAPRAASTADFMPR